MKRLSLAKEVLDFLANQDSKQFRQIVRKIFSILLDTAPSDVKKLRGSLGYLRADCGEYRIIYRVEDETVHILLVDLRNDAKIYKKLNRLF